MATNFFPINTPLINYFFYNAPLTQSGPNIPLADGAIFFYEDEDHGVQLPTYSDISDPNNPVVNPNPLRLGAAGECPLFYLENRLYYIVITDSSLDQQNPIATINHYNPADFQPDQETVNNNFITNGQFSYPINFWHKDLDPINTGLITQPVTAVAWGWEFLQDEGTTSKNLVTFNNINSEGVEGNPIFEIQLTCVTAQSGELKKEFRSKLGGVNFFEGQEVTFSFQFQSKTVGNATVVLLLERNYGPEGTQPDIDQLTQFTVTPTRDKYTFSTTLPINTGKSITEGNYLAIRIQPRLGQACQVSMTNAQMVPLEVEDPVYVQEAYGDTVGQILGAATQISTAGLEENCSVYQYQDGKISPVPRTGEIVLYTTGQNFASSELCDGSSRNISAYSKECNIPYTRLYNRIGRTFGGTGELVATATNNVVTISSGVGAIQKTNFSAETAPVTVLNTVPGLKFGVSLERTAFDQITATWVNNFAPNQTPTAGPFGYTPPTGLMAYRVFIGASNVIPQDQIVISTVDPGSVSTQAVAEINFNSLAAQEYMTRESNGFGVTEGFLEFASFGNNTRGNYPAFVNAIFFSVDGAWTNVGGVTGTTSVVVPFLSVNTITQNIDIFIRTVANPFTWTVTVNSVPSASQYFFYSSDTTDYTGYFVVDGIGTDPAIMGRTSVAIAISSTDTTTQVATKIAAAIDDFTFNVPAAADLPDLQVDSLVSWYIFL